MLVIHSDQQIEIIVIGASLGGLSALQCVLGLLPAEFSSPVAIAQHRAVERGESLQSSLQRHCALPVREPFDKEPIRPSTVYLAPADYHLMLDGDEFALSTEGPFLHARPSIDILFDTASRSFGAKVTAVVLTGKGRDGARGAATVRARGGRLIVQAPDTAESAMMPLAALEAAGADAVLPLTEIASFLRRAD